MMEIASYLTDVYGPRPIGSPNHKAAAEWAVRTMTSWGMKNAHLEPFTWRGVGWLPGRASGYITSPVKANLKFEAIPWTPSTNGTVSGEVVQVIPPQNPTEEELTAFLAALAPKIKGGIVMVGASATPPVNFNEPQKRIPDEQAKARYLPPDPNAPARGGRGGRGGGGGRGGPGAPTPEGRVSAQQVTQRITALLRDNPPALRLTQQGGGRIPGVIVAQNGAGQTYEQASQIGPGVILRNDDYGRLSRIIADGTPVSVEFNVQNQYFPEGSTSYVTVGEIPGTDKADDVVMLGGHLDSWTSATGATDNAIGCAIMLEAARILESVGAKPRRTIRVALWSGEEEGLLGSFAYVANHFGSAEQPKPDYGKLDAYWNIDDGRDASAAPTFAAEAAIVLAQFLAVRGVGHLRRRHRRRASRAQRQRRVRGGRAAGHRAQQDPIEQQHDLAHRSDCRAHRRRRRDEERGGERGGRYGIANRDKMMPRFAPTEMPAVPAGRGGGPGRGNLAGAEPHVLRAERQSADGGRARLVASPQARPRSRPAEPSRLPPRRRTASSS